MKVNLLDDRTDWWLWLDDEAIALGLVDSGSDANNPMEGFLSRVMVFIERIRSWQDTGKNPQPWIFICYGCYFHQVTAILVIRV